MQLLELLNQVVSTPWGRVQFYELFGSNHMEAVLSWRITYNKRREGSIDLGRVSQARLNGLAIH